MVYYKEAEISIQEDNMTVTKNTKLKDIIATPAGHDIIMKACTSVGVSGDILAKGPLSNLTLGALGKISLGKIPDDFIDAIIV